MSIPVVATVSSTCISIMQLSQMHYTEFAYKEKHILQHNIPCSGLAGCKMNKYNKQINGYTTSCVTNLFLPQWQVVTHKLA